MKKLIQIIVFVGLGWLLIRFLRFVFNMATGPCKFYHGFNILETGIIIFIVISILGVLLKKD